MQAHADKARFWLFSFVLAATAACGGPAQEFKGPVSDNAGSAGVGRPAPDLSIQTVNGKGKVSLATLSGKVAVVDFWATWCKPCGESFPKLEELGKKHAADAAIVGVSVDEQKDGILDFVKSKGATFAIGWDENHTLAHSWNVETMPTTFVLDASGKVRFVHAGYHGEEAEAIDKEIAQLAAEAPASASKAKTAVAMADTTSSSPPSSSGADSVENNPYGDKPPPAAKPEKATPKAAPPRPTRKKGGARSKK